MTGKTPPPFVPKLRFSEFHEAGEWGSQPLKNIAEPISKKVGTTKCVPMSVTTGVGLVSQEDKFGRIIAGDSYKNYIKLQSDDFAYNKSATKEFPQGYIARYTGTRDAGVPNSIFTCFRPDTDSVVPGFLDHLFHGNYHGRWLRKYITVGARAHGALSVSDDDLFSMPVPLPPEAVSRDEQQKIADCLGTLDDLIAAEGRKLEALRRHRQGLMQQLFPQPGETVPRLRFPKFADAPDWEDRTIDGVCDLKAGDFVRASEIAERTNGDLYPCYGGNGLRGYVKSFTHDGQYVLIGRQGALCGNVNLFTGKFHATEHALVATPKPGIVTTWLFFALDVLELNRFAIGQAQPGLSVGVLNGLGICVPYEPDEQKMISDCLSHLNTVITNQTDRLDTLKIHKQSLLQQLFPSPEGVV